MEQLPTEAKHWSKRLAERVKLASGCELVASRDAGEFLLSNFRGVTVDGVLEHAGELLLTAAATGRRQDIEAAIAQTEILVSTRPWL